MEGEEPSQIIKSAHDLPVCGSTTLFRSAYEIGKGRNGTVYLLRSAQAQKYFNYPYCLVIKEICHSRAISFEHMKDRYGNLIPNSHILSEALNGALVTQLYGRGESPHFVRQLCVFGCSNNFYLVFEFCGYRMRNQSYRSITLWHLPKILNVPLSQEIVMEVMFVIFHTLWLSQKLYGQVHYDLKPDNVFIQPINSTTEFKGVNLNEIDYFGYCLSDQDGQNYCYFLPNRRFLIKIGDYGTTISTKVKNEQGQNIQIMPLAVWQNSEKLKEGFGIERKFQCGYDLHFFLPQIRKLCKEWGVDIPAQLLSIIEVNNLDVHPKTSRPCEPILNKSPLDIIMETDWSNCLRKPSNDLHSRTVYIGQSLWNLQNP